MKHWRFLDYYDAMGRNLISDWYRTQLPAVRVAVMYAISSVEIAERLEENDIFNPLKREHVGLFTLHVEVEIARRKRHFRPVGFWSLNAGELILFGGCEKSGRVTIPPGVYDDALDTQLRYYHSGTGTVSDHSF